MNKSKSPYTLEVNETISKWPSLRSIKDEWQDLQRPSTDHRSEKDVVDEDFDWTENHLEGNCCAWVSRLLNSNQNQYRSIKVLLMLLCGIFAGFVTIFILHFTYTLSLEAMSIVGLFVTIATSVLLIFCYSSRCVLSLVLPSLGTRQGKTIMMAILAAQLLSGPMGSLTYNLKQTTNSLVCFSNMTVNQTQQTVRGIKDSVNNFTRVLGTNDLGQVVNVLQNVKTIGDWFSNAFDFSLGVEEKIEKKIGIDKLRNATANAKKSAEEAKRNLLSAKQNVGEEVDDHVRQFLDVTKFLELATILTLIFLLFSCWLYYFRFQHSLPYDNTYATHLLKRYDQYCSQRGGTKLFPLRPRESKKIIDSMSLHMSPYEKKSLLISLAIYVAHCVVTVVLYVADWTLYTFMKIIERNVNGSISWNETVTFAIPKINFNLEIPINYDAQICVATPREMDTKTLIVIVILYIVLGLAVVSQAYCLRFRHAIVAFFYPDRNSERIQYLYNKLANKREKSKLILKFGWIFRKAENAEVSGLAKSDGVVKRRLISAAKKFGMFKCKCLACGLPENSEFKNCSKCSSNFCPICFDDAKNACLVCEKSNLHENVDLHSRA